MSEIFSRHPFASYLQMANSGKAPSNLKQGAVDTEAGNSNTKSSSLFLYSKTRFRWIQESSSHKSVPPFGLDGVYISEPCPNYCNGHGDCVSGVCFCDLGYTGKTTLFRWD